MEKKEIIKKKIIMQDQLFKGPFKRTDIMKMKNLRVRQMILSQRIVTYCLIIRPTLCKRPMLKSVEWVGN